MPLRLVSLIRPDATLELFLEEIAMPRPERPDEVVLRMEAAPVNPSDLNLLLGGADPGRARLAGTAGRPVVTAPVPPAVMQARAGRVGLPLPVGNEGAGTVVAAGEAPEAQALVGRRVAALGGGMYAQYRAVPAAQCLLLPEGASAAEGASCFINPLTALGMVETMRREGHGALLHTVGASNLGQMLHRLCMQEGIPLVSLVRRPEQAELLRRQGARHVVDRSEPAFGSLLVDALAETGARLAFDATGGGRLAGEVIAAMEAALLRRGGRPYDPYGSQVHKQVYVYGYLERGPIELPAGLGMAWGIGGWLLFPFMQQTGAQRLAQLKQRVADGLSTTFASRYVRELDIGQLLNPEALQACARMGSSEKTLLRLG